MPETAAAQIWASSKFTTGPGTQETATCTTTGTNPNLGGASPAPADYSAFYASCSVTPSTGSVITYSLCPHGAGGPPSGFPSGNPTATCSMTFQPQPGVTYTLNSEHVVGFKTDPLGTSCGSWDNGPCFADPLGYYSVNPIGPVWPQMPNYTGNTSTNLVDVSCGARGGTCASQNMPVEVCLAESGTACTNSFNTPPYWLLATTSALFGLCPAPAIASVTPNIWFAGQTYSVTVTGSGFITPATATPACPVSAVDAQLGIARTAISGVSVASATQITFSITVPDGYVTEAAGVTVTNSNAAPANFAKLDLLGLPQILWKGNVVSAPVTAQQQAVVGQQLALTTTPTAATLAALPVPLTFSSTAPNTWTVTGGTNIGGYTATTASASVTPMPPLTTPNLTFYSVYPAGAVDLTYTYCISGQTTCPAATASFAVSGGGNMASNPFNFLTIDQLVPCVNGVVPTGGGTATPYVAYGNLVGYSCLVTYPPSIFGISFTPSGAPAGGTYSYVQLINSDDPWSTMGSTKNGCTYTIGLDLAYPYKGIIPGTNPPQAEDAPNDSLTPGYVETRTFNASMFLLWTPSGSGSIAVPIGYQTWGSTGGAQQEDGTWVASIGEPAPGPIGAFVQSSDETQTGPPALDYGYPVWSGPATCN